jgi:hypothetical protein
MSKINVNTWEPEGAGTAMTMGASGDTATVPSGASLVVASGATINITGATQTGFPSAGFAGVHADVSSGSETYTVPADITKLLVIITGGGGGGGTGTTGVTYGSGGVAGGTVMARVTVVATDTITIAVGAGGVATGAGGNSTFTHASGSGSFDTITAPGGPPGVNGATAPNAPVAPTIGASNEGIAIKGGHPGPQGNGSQGAASFWGGGGTGYNSTPAAVATTGDAFGSGGGGGSYPAGYETGGVGGVGVCFIMEFK